MNDTTLEPSSASCEPTSTAPTCSSARRPSSGLWITPPAICCAWLTTRPAKETPGTTITNSTSTTTRLAARRGRTRRHNPRVARGKTKDGQGEPTDPRGTGARARARGHGRVHGIIAGVIWLAVVIYALWLATRVVRAVERMADKFQPRGP